MVNMKDNKVITELKNDIYYIRLNREEKSNAYDKAMAEEIRNAFLNVKNSSAKLVLFSANGKHFSSGADLQWMNSTSTLSPEENISEMKIIQEMYEAILSTEIPIIGLIQGAVRGGGVGLVACCDVVFCEKSVSFALSEAKWGLIPGIITPIVIEKIGSSRFLELALSSRVFNFEEAHAMNLIHHSNDKLDDYISSMKENSVTSTKMIKKLFRENFSNYSSLSKMLIASSEMRASKEFQSRVKKN